MLFRFGLDTAATPDQVFRAFTDFSARRLEVWSRSLDPAEYEVRGLGDTWAVVREGSGGTKIWVLLRYEWEPGVVRWSLLRTPRGSVWWIRTSTRLPPPSRADPDLTPTRAAVVAVQGTTILFLQRLLGPLLFPRIWRSALDRLAADQREPS